MKSQFVKKKDKNKDPVVKGLKTTMDVNILFLPTGACFSEEISSY